MAVVATALLIAAVTLAALTFLGYGLTRLLLPRALAREGLLWAPFVGYTLTSIVCHALNVNLLSGTRTFEVLFLLGLAANVLGIVFGGPVYVVRWRVGLGLLLASLSAFLIGVVPLIAIGQLTAISKNYDLIDIYDATAAYVVDYPVSAIRSGSPPNPLAELVVSPVTLSNGWGLSYLHALASVLTGRSPIETQTPVFSLMHALLVPAAFIFLYRAVRVPVWWAVGAGAALGVHGMLLSMAFAGLGNHTAILALLPLVFTSSFLAIDDRSPRAMVLAGFMLANVPLTYWAAFPFYLPPVVLYAMISPPSPLAEALRRLLTWLLGVIRHTTGPRLPGRPMPPESDPAVEGSSASDQGVVSAAPSRSEVVSVARSLDRRQERRGLAALMALVRTRENGEVTFEVGPVAPTEPGVEVDGSPRWRRLELVAAEPTRLANRPDRATLIERLRLRRPGADPRRRLARPRRFPQPRFGAFLAGVVVSLILALPGYERIANTLRNLSTPSQGWGQKSFVDIGVLPGFAYWAYPGPKDLRDLLGGALGSALIAAEAVAVALGVALSICALMRVSGRARAALASLGLPYLAGLLLWRFVSPYPYAYLKATTFGALVGVPLIVIGLEQMGALRSAASRATRGAARAALPVLLCGLTGLLVLNTVLTTLAYSDQTQTVFTGSVLPPSSLALRDMATRIPSGAPVFISTTPPMQPEVVSAAAFFLRDHPLIGEIQTLESSLSHSPPGGTVADFGVLAASEDPTDRGYDPGDLVWSNAEVKLYRRGDVLAHVSPSGRDQLTFAQDRPLTLALSPDAMYADGRRPDGDLAHPASRLLILQLGALQPQTVHLSIGGRVRDVVLSGGLSIYSTESFDVPAQVELTSDTSSPVFVRSLALRRADERVPSSLVAKPDVLVMAPSATIRGSEVHVRLPYAGAELWTPQMAIGLNVGGATSSTGEWNEFGWWGTELRDSEVDLDWDLASKQLTASAAGQDLRVNTDPGATQDGAYTAALNFWEPTQASMGWHSPFYDLLRFEVRGGQIVAPELVAAPVIFLSWRAPYRASPEAIAPLLPEVAAIQAALPASPHVLLAPGLRERPDAVAALVQGLTKAVFYADYLAGAEYPEPGRVYDFAILASGDDASAFGYGMQDRLVATPDLTVYRRGETLAHLDFASAGQYPRLARGDHLSLYTTGDTLSQRPPEPTSGTGAPRALSLTFASLASSAATIDLGDGQPRTIPLQAGVVHYRSSPVPAPYSVTITGSSDEPTYLVAADLTSTSSDTSELTSDDTAMVISTQVRPIGSSRVDVDVRWAGADPSRDFRVGINLNGFGVPDGQWFAGAWSGLPLRARTTHVDLDLDAWRVLATNAAGPVPVTSKLFELRDGRYTAELSLWEPSLARAGWPTPFIKLFDMEQSPGRPRTVLPNSTTLTLVRLNPVAED